ncbi:MAG: methyltransferase domain-containing protein [Gammaproteobacteria bacterium]|nr:methyltransferase domain-containing protein [Gammaproteobacteria bacterium]
MNAYDERWAENYERRAHASIPGREGLYRLCKAFFLDLPVAARVLVTGCGTGEELIPLAKHFPRATFVGIDPAAAMLEFCAERVTAEGLTDRVALHRTTLQDFSTADRFDAATAVLVSQHLTPDAAAAEFFAQLSALLEPGGRLYSADLHIGSGQDREQVMALWYQQAVMSGMEPEIAKGMLEKFAHDIRPRDEAVILGFMGAAGFADIIKPFSSLMYGAWGAFKHG